MVDYNRLAAVCAAAREEFPEAIDVRPQWANGQALAEVWTEPGHAFTWSPELGRARYAVTA